LARGLLDKPIERTCSNCNKSFVTFQVNCAKGFYTDEEFYEMCANALRNRL